VKANDVWTLEIPNIIDSGLENIGSLSEHVSGAENGAERAENRVSWSGAPER